MKPMKMNLPFRFSLLSLFCFVGMLLNLEYAAAQQQPVPQQYQIPIHLPTIQVLSINTVVGAPDAGIGRLGGVSRSGYGSSAYGVPFVGNLPGVGLGLRNQAVGGYTSPSMASVRVQIISNREIDEDLMAQAARQELARQTVDPNGTKDIQRRADFITRNIGRR